MVWTEISCCFALSASIAVRSRWTVASRRARADCLIPASCASEYVRGKRRSRRLVFVFIASLQRAVGRGEHFKHRDIAASSFLFQLHPHDIDHVIKQLDFNASLARINRIALGLKERGLLGIVGAPDKCCAQFFRVFDVVATSQTQRAIVFAWAEPWAGAVAKGRG